jgi:hypothetical protein
LRNLFNYLADGFLFIESGYDDFYYRVQDACTLL